RRSVHICWPWNDSIAGGQRDGEGGSGAAEQASNGWGRLAQLPRGDDGRALPGSARWEQARGRSALVTAGHHRFISNRTALGVMPGLQIRKSGTVKVFGSRPHDRSSRGLRGRRRKTSKGGNRGRCS